MPAHQSIFEFNEKTADRLSAEQRRLFLSNFSMTQDDHMIELLKSFPRAFRRAGSIAVQDLSVVVIKDVVQVLRQHPIIMILPDEKDPRGWGFACRYRADVPWYVAALPGRFAKTTFRNFPVMNLGYFKDLRDWPPLDKFISKGMWGVQQNKRPTWNPLMNFINVLSNYLRGEDLQDLLHALRSTNFFPVETDEELALPYTIQPLTDRTSRFALDELTQHARLTYRRFIDPGLMDYWQALLSPKNEHTQVWLARSRHTPELDREQRFASAHATAICQPTLLGFLIGGLNHLNEEPEVQAVGVLPDERRRGIATSLLRRFFNQTGHHSVLVRTYMGEHYGKPQYEACGFLKTLGATLRTKRGDTWLWDLSADFIHSNKNSA